MCVCVLHIYTASYLVPILVYAYVHALERLESGDSKSKRTSRLDGRMGHWFAFLSSSMSLYIRTWLPVLVSRARARALIKKLTNSLTGRRPAGPDMFLVLSLTCTCFSYEPKFVHFKQNCWTRHRYTQSTYYLLILICHSFLSFWKLSTNTNTQEIKKNFPLFFSLVVNFIVL